MRVEAWCRRLKAQLPGWRPWYQGVGGGSSGWCAVPAPEGTTLDQAFKMDYRLGPYAKPQDLRSAALERYGWDDECETCLVSWRRCGHRRDETKR